MSLHSAQKLSMASHFFFWSKASTIKHSSVKLTIFKRTSVLKQYPPPSGFYRSPSCRNPGAVFFSFTYIQLSPMSWPSCLKNNSQIGLFLSACTIENAFSQSSPSPKSCKCCSCTVPKPFLRAPEHADQRGSCSVAPNGAGAGQEITVAWTARNTKHNAPVLIHCLLDNCFNSLST